MTKQLARLFLCLFWTTWLGCSDPISYGAASQPGADVADLTVERDCIDALIDADVYTDCTDPACDGRVALSSAGCDLEVLCICDRAWPEP